LSPFAAHSHAPTSHPPHDEEPEKNIAALVGKTTAISIVGLAFGIVLFYRFSRSSGNKAKDIELVKLVEEVGDEGEMLHEEEEEGQKRRKSSLSNSNSSSDRAMFFSPLSSPTTMGIEKEDEEGGSSSSLSMSLLQAPLDGRQMEPSISSSSSSSSAAAAGAVAAAATTTSFFSFASSFSFLRPRKDLHVHTQVDGLEVEETSTLGIGEEEEGQNNSYFLDYFPAAPPNTPCSVNANTSTHSLN